MDSTETRLSFRAAAERDVLRRLKTTPRGSLPKTALRPDNRLSTRRTYAEALVALRFAGLIDLRRDGEYQLTIAGARAAHEG